MGEPSAGIADRIVGLRRVKASSIAPHPKNWRKHPKKQREAMRGLLEEVGFAGAVLVREVKEGKRTRYQCLDGHMRLDEMGDRRVPVLVTDLDEAEARKFLATADPIGSMAEVDKDRLASILGKVKTGEVAVQRLLDDMARKTGGRVTPNAPEVPISPELHERQDYLVVVFSNNFDWHVLCDRLDIDTVAIPLANPKSSIGKEKRGLGRVITAEALLAALKAHDPSGAASA